MTRVYSVKEFKLGIDSFTVFKKINLQEIGFNQILDQIYTFTKVMNIGYSIIQ